MRLLLVNANTDAALTRRLAKVARAAASAATCIVPVTASHGVRLIQSAQDHRIARRACLEAVARAEGGCDAVLVAVSLDTAIEALSRRYRKPVIGMTGAALAAARARGGAVGVITIGETMRSLFLQRFAAERLDPALVHAVELSPAAVLEDRDRAADLIARGVSRLAGQGADVAVPVGATVCGLATVVAREAPIPVLDSIECGVRLAERLVRNAVARC